MVCTITPPVEACLYALSAVAELPLERIAEFELSRSPENTILVRVFVTPLLIS